LRLRLRLRLLIGRERVAHDFNFNFNFNFNFSFSSQSEASNAGPKHSSHNKKYAKKEQGRVSFAGRIQPITAKSALFAPNANGKCSDCLRTFLLITQNT
jgi:hypothetical protein